MKRPSVGQVAWGVFLGLWLAAIATIIQTGNW